MSARPLFFLLCLHAVSSLALAQALCSYQGPDTSGSVRLTNFAVIGEPFVGSEVNVSYSLQNVGAVL